MTKGAGSNELDEKSRSREQDSSQQAQSLGSKEMGKKNRRN